MIYSGYGSASSPCLRVQYIRGTLHTAAHRRMENKLSFILEIYTGGRLRIDLFLCFCSIYTR